MKTYDYEWKAGISKLGPVMAVKLKDGTEVIIVKKSIVLKFPKKKFAPNMKKNKTFNVQFTEVELRAVMDGFEKACKHLAKVKKK